MNPNPSEAMSKVNLELAKLKGDSIRINMELVKFYVDSVKWFAALSVVLIGSTVSLLEKVTHQVAILLVVSSSLEVLSLYCAGSYLIKSLSLLLTIKEGSELDETLRRRMTYLPKLQIFSLVVGAITLVCGLIVYLVNKV